MDDGWRTYPVIFKSFHNIHMNWCASVSRLQFLGASGHLKALKTKQRHSWHEFLKLWRTTANLTPGNLKPQQSCYSYLFIYMIYRKIKKGSQTVHDALLQYLTDNLNSSSPNLYIENSPTLCCTRHAYHEKEINREPAMQPNNFMFLFWHNTMAQ